MIKIITLGKPLPEWTNKCPTCKTVISYNEEDIASDGQQDVYIPCPVCNQPIKHKDHDNKPGGQTILG